MVSNSPTRHFKGDRGTRAMQNLQSSLNTTILFGDLEKLIGVILSFILTSADYIDFNSH
jgi:hypothetical protein